MPETFADTPAYDNALPVRTQNLRQTFSPAQNPKAKSSALNPGEKFGLDLFHECGGPECNPLQHA
jgi:hypothetical protein